jgi:hypothetical protein
MCRQYKYATIKEVNFVMKCLYDFWKVKDIAKALGCSTDRVRGIYHRQGIKLVRGNGRFKKGIIPVNKGTKGLMKPNNTSYTKGNLPHNTKPIGSIRLNKDGYYDVKYCNHKWRSLHSDMWIKHYGELQKNEVVIFKEGVDKHNFTINDLKIVSRKELMKMNSKHCH